MQALLDRAQQLVAAGPYDARPAEIADVHDAIWPAKAPVCPTLTCRQVLGVAYFSIKRWAEQQGADSNAPLSLSTMEKIASVARFKSSDTIYTPHGLGIAYTNVNLTDSAARYIIANDPDAKGLFSQLPPAVEDGEDDQPLTVAQQSAEKALEKAEASAQQMPAGFDYTKLAKAMVDELERRTAEATAKAGQAQLDAAHQPAPASAQPEQPVLTASVGGAADSDKGSDEAGKSDNDSDSTVDNSDADTSEQPVRLSRMTKPQLVDAYTAELGHAPAPELLADDMRKAIADKRASKPVTE